MPIPQAIVRQVLQRFLTPHIELTLHSGPPQRQRGAEIVTDNPLLITASIATIRNGAVVLTRDGEKVRSTQVATATHCALWYRGTEFILSARLVRPLRLIVRTPIYLKSGTAIIAFEDVI